jgi:hypothetical protein
MRYENLLEQESYCVLLSRELLVLSWILGTIFCIKNGICYEQEWKNVW